ncbi:hypothetical protein B0H19DRAFT_1258354 [Mycena capillaripes]|nr:hypothetical protein B0H19DRAFT_1258354 [Mycena capillaripes]
MTRVTPAWKQRALDRIPARSTLPAALLGPKLSSDDARPVFVFISAQSRVKWSTGGPADIVRYARRTFPSFSANASLPHPHLAIQTTFDYSNGPVDIFGCVAGPEDEDVVDIKDKWLDSIERAARSCSRMAVHVVILRVGTSVRFILVPLRRSKSDAEKLLQLIADSEDDPASDNVASKICAHFKHGEKVLVKIH